MSSPKTILLTGITGFIAKRIALDLLNAGYTVVGSLRAAKRADEVRDAVRPQLNPDVDLDTALRFVELDLTSDDGWDAAMEGVDAVLHTASPFPIAQPKDPQELIRPAVDGALRAMRAAQKAGVHRVVLTSSVAAIMHKDMTSPVLTEDDWTDVTHPTASAYVQSKTLAEKAAWDFVAELPEMQLTTVNPGLVVGEPLDKNYGSSLGLIERFMSGKDPAVPNISMPVVDVKDVSAMHIRALDRPETIGNRYAALDRCLMLPELTGYLAEAFPDRKIATRKAPKWLLRILSLFDAEIKSALPLLEIVLDVRNDRAQRDLGMSFIPAKDAILASARFVAADGK